MIEYIERERELVKIGDDTLAKSWCKFCVAYIFLTEKNEKNTQKNTNKISSVLTSDLNIFVSS